MAKAKEKVSTAAKKVSDDVAATEIEVKKAAAKVKNTTKKSVDKAKAVKEEVKAPVKRAKAAKIQLVFESCLGGQITPEEIAAMVPKGTDAAYIKLEENKIYWVKGDENGAVDIW